MNRDPYSVLGLSPGASDNEIKTAYKQLAKKYHPDLNPTPEAEERMKEINAAYDTLINHKNEAYGSQSGPFSGWSGDRSYGAGSEAGDLLQAAVNYINAGHYREALNVLGNISRHDAEWNYLSAVANYGIGNRISALQYAQQAVQMDPSNSEYRNFLNALQTGSSVYQGRVHTYSTPNVDTDLCSRLFCLLFCCPGVFPFC